MAQVPLYILALGAFWGVVGVLANRYKGASWVKQHLEIGTISLTWTKAALRDALPRWRAAASPAQMFWLRIWFGLGSVYGCLAMAGSVALLAVNAYYQICILHKAFWEWTEHDASLPPAMGSASPPDQQLITPIVPGVNLPIGHVVYFVVAIGLNGILHELGHAIAAMSEGVRVNGFGVFIYLIYPGAYCELNTEDVKALKPRQQLRIYTAGVFHNIVLAAVAGVCMYALLPAALTMGYATGIGAVAVDIHKDSPMYEHLPLGSAIVGLDGGACKVRNSGDFYSCLAQRLQLQNGKGSAARTGYCSTVDGAMAENSFRGQRADSKADGRPFDCCATDTSTGPSRYCFSLMASVDVGPMPQVCLPARAVVQGIRCETSHDCTSFNAEDKSPSVCLLPHIAPGSHLIKVDFGADGVSGFVLYAGDPRGLGAAVYATDYAPRLHFFPLKLPQRVDTMLRYMVALSVGLSILNIVPSLRLDGQYAILALLDDIGWQDWAPMCIFCGTLLIAFNITMSFVLLVVA